MAERRVTKGVQEWRETGSLEELWQEDRERFGGDFRRWLDDFEPDWKFEYSGNIAGMFEAWSAAFELCEGVHAS